ncbi:hypothetical protein KIN20_004963 [Parelaphostrongylus tenuis]|uniref:Uncharacterized protein n=1 Tax=Parelaphostrongylus tenuis TaxID=148309 RepID=A0AAD5MHP3_PARTN|nr:hypothetical protein KIN20_004963 [Parelaphostrongylus tenuis]
MSIKGGASMILVHSSASFGIPCAYLEIKMISARLLSVYAMMALMAVCSYALQGIIGLQGINEEVEKEIADM